ncbi:A24 family peptidase [Thermoflexus sp.]|nr:A24 family peptidase [Thermoflexus sp.]MCS6963842.1 A24 family peptidase [Thermoflexus sp.]MCX7691254.1 A24 family peptidase [Thermoflexus sp.]MDW8184799.1 A24 family peptidase [Anaerolineae bacterium]
MAEVELVLRIGISSVALTASITDWRARRIPNALTLPAIGVVGLIRWVQGRGESALAGAAVAILVFLLPALLMGPERAGAGDLKLGIALGLTSGFPRIIDLLLIAFGLTALAGGILWVLRRLPPDRTLPMGPGLAIGTLWVLWG